MVRRRRYRRKKNPKRRYDKMYQRFQEDVRLDAIRTRADLIEAIREWHRYGRLMPSWKLQPIVKFLEGRFVVDHGYHYLEHVAKQIPFPVRRLWSEIALTAATRLTAADRIAVVRRNVDRYLRAGGRVDQLRLMLPVIGVEERFFPPITAMGLEVTARRIPADLREPWLRIARRALEYPVGFRRYGAVGGMARWFYRIGGKPEHLRLLMRVIR